MISSIRGLVSICSWLLLATLAPAQTDEPPTHGPIFEQQTLSPGKTPGTFAFTYTAKVAFTQEPAFPVTVAVANLTRKPVVQTTVNGPEPFTLSADLAPGSYFIQTTLAPAADKLYWRLISPSIFVDASGSVRIQSSTGHTLLHLKKVTVLSPAPLSGTTVTESRPLLQWQPLPGSTHYRVDWLVEDAPFHPVGPRGTGTTTDSSFRLPQDTILNRQYEWSVWAYRADGAELGNWSAAYFFTPGGKETFLQSPPGPKEATTGMPYIGIMQFPAPAGISGGAKGLLIARVGANSPALKAGLLPDDVLTSFNGQSLAETSQADFVTMVRALPVGTQVPIEYIRGGKPHAAQLTIGAAP